MTFLTGHHNYEHDLIDMLSIYHVQIIISQALPSSDLILFLEVCPDILISEGLQHKILVEKAGFDQGTSHTQA